MKNVSVVEMISAWEAGYLQDLPRELKGNIVARHVDGELWVIPP